MSSVRSRSSFAAAVISALTLAGCATSPFSTPEQPPPPPPPAVSYPPGYRAEEFVGRWGYTAYHRPEDRARTEAAEQGQCKQPYVIGRGPTGGVIMHRADQAQPEELRVKGSADGKTYIGPEGEPGGLQDREVVSFDGRVLILRWMDPEVAGRYGNGVYVRCAPRA